MRKKSGQGNAEEKMIEMRALDVFLCGRLVGTLALTPERLCAFQYDKGWLDIGVSISPFDLPLNSELFIACIC